MSEERARVEAGRQPDAERARAEVGRQVDVERARVEVGRHVGVERLRRELAGARAERDWWRARAAEPQPDAVEVVVATGLDVEQLRRLTARLAHRTGPATVVVTDCLEFRHARADGVVLEYLPDPAAWRRHRPGGTWDDLLTSRLTRIFFDHGPGRTVVVDPDPGPEA